MPIVLGGGIGGLSAAYYLLKQSTKSHVPQLFEASGRLGGWIKTDRPKADGKVRFEIGPRTLRPSGFEGFNTLALCSELGLSDSILPIPRKHSAARNRLLAVDNKLCLLPSSIVGLFKTAPPFKKPIIYALWHDLSHSYIGEQLTDDSIYNFTERRFGTDVAKYLISSMICGICAGDAKEISVKFLLKDFFEHEQLYGSVTKGIYKKTIERWTSKTPDASPAHASHETCDLVKRSQAEGWSVYSLNEGLEKLPRTLSQRLTMSGVQLNINARCQHIEFHSDGATITANGQSHDTASIVSGLPAFEIGKLLQKQHPQLAEDLLAIPYVDVAVVNFQFADRNLLRQPGFGFLVPPAENSPLLGVIYDSCCFDMGHDSTVLTAMMGGKWFRERFADSNESDLYEKAMEQIQRILKIDKKPDAFKVNILRQCIPQYIVGHSERIQRIRAYIDHNKLRLALCGSAYDGVGVNNVIHSAKVAAQLSQKWAAQQE